MNLPSFFKIFSGFGSALMPEYRIAVDMGTATTRIGIDEKGVVLREATYVGLNTKQSNYLFFGEEAHEIYGKSPRFIQVIRPIQNSIISDFDGTVALMEYFYVKSVEPFSKSSMPVLRHRTPTITIVPTSATEVEQRAVHEALLKAGMSKVWMVEKPIATALGMGQPVFSNVPTCIIDMGAGSVEMAVMISGGIVSSKLLKNAGQYMDQVIVNYLHLKYGIVIGRQTAERLKIELLDLTDRKAYLTIRGKSLENGLPKSVRVNTSDIKEALGSSLNAIIDHAKELIESIPPEVVDTIIKNGITITGGMSQIPGFAAFLSADLKVPVTVAKNPLNSTISGLLALWNDQKHLEQITLHT